MWLHLEMLQRTIRSSGSSMCCSAGASTWMVHLTGNPIYDAVGSITIGGLLGCTAIFLIQQNRSLLLGIFHRAAHGLPLASGPFLELPVLPLQEQCLHTWNKA